MEDIVLEPRPGVDAMLKVGRTVLVEWGVPV